VVSTFFLLCIAMTVMESDLPEWSGSASCEGELTRKNDLVGEV
jgi:hypothetical protein